MKKIVLGLMVVLSLSLIFYNMNRLNKKQKKSDKANYKLYSDQSPQSSNREIEFNLIKSLDDPSPQNRWNAAANLGVIRSVNSVPYLSKSIKDSNPQVRLLSVWALGRIGDSRTLGVLEEAIMDSDVDVRPFAIWAMGEMKVEKASEILIKYYERCRELGNRQQVLKSIGKLNSATSLNFLLEKAVDENSLVRLNAIEALGNYNDKQAVSFLAGLLKKGGREEKIQALRAIRKMKLKEAISNIKECENDHAHDCVICNEARLAMDCLSGKKDGNYMPPDMLLERERKLNENAKPDLKVPDLKKMNPEDVENLEILPLKACEKFDLQQACNDINSGFTPLVNDAVWRMGNSGDPRVVPMLIKILREDKDRGVEWNAAKALGKLRDKRAVPVLLDNLKNHNEDVREDVVEALGRIGDKRALIPLVKLLETEEEEFITAEIVIAIGLIGISPDETASLKKCLDNSDPVVQANTILVLGKYGSAKTIKALGRFKDSNSDCVKEAYKRVIDNIEGKKDLDLEDHYHEL